MKFKALLSSLTTVIAFCVFSAEPVNSVQSSRNASEPQFPVTIQTMTDYINKALKDNFGDDPDLYPGVSIALVHGDEIVWTAGFGHADIENDIAASGDTVYILASVSKNLAGVVNMWLYDQGRLELDAPLRTYLPEFAMKKRYDGVKDLEDLITPRRLLNHHSGIPEEVESSGLFTYHHWAGYESVLMDYLRKDYPSQYPGEVAVYNNVAFDMTAILPSRITRQNFADLSREVIFEPLGMDSSAFGRVYENMAVGYDPDYGSIRPYSQAFGSDGATSSVNDMAQLLLMYLGLGTHPNGKKILNPATVTDVMPSTEISPVDELKPGFNPGLGWDSVEELQLQYAGAAFFKNGCDNGYTSTINVMLDWNLGVVVLSNQNKYIPLTVEAAVQCLQSAIKELGGPSPSSPLLPDVATEKDLNIIAGYYSGASNAFVDKITIQDQTSLSWEKNIFSGDKPQKLTLVLDESGNAFVDSSEQPRTTEYFFKNMGTPDGDHFIMVKKTASSMGIRMEKFAPPAVPEIWKQRSGKPYILTSLRHDGVAFTIHSLEFTLGESDGAEFLSVIGIPVLPASDGLAFVAGQIVNRGDSCVRVSGKGKYEKAVFDGDTFLRLDGIESLQPGKMICFSMPADELCWHKVEIAAPGEYYVNFPRGSRAFIWNSSLKFSGQESAFPWIWDCTQAGTYYVGLVAARPTNAFLELGGPSQVLVKASSTSGGSAVVDMAQVAAGKAAAITATPDPGSIFLRWEVEAGDADIADEYNAKTEIVPQSNATAKAVFAPENETATLILRNDGIGECDPVSQVHVRKDQPFTISAAPDDGFAFVEWATVSGTVQVGNQYSATTTIIPSGDVVMKAVFRGNPIVAKSKARVGLSATGGGTLKAKGNLRYAPLSSEILENYSDQKIKGVSFCGSYFPANGGLKVLGVKVDLKKKTWRFSRKDIPVSSGDWNAGQLDLVLHSEDGVSCWNPHWGTACIRSYDFIFKAQQQMPAPVTRTAMADFSIGKMTLKTTAGKLGGNKLHISGSTFELPDQAAFPEDENIMVTVGKVTFLLPAVSKDAAAWKKKNGAYTYRNNSFYGGKVKAVFDTVKKIWSFKLDKGALGHANFADLPVVRLAIGDYEAASQLDIEQKLSVK